MPQKKNPTFTNIVQMLHSIDAIDAAVVTYYPSNRELVLLNNAQKIHSEKFDKIKMIAAGSTWFPINDGSGSWLNTLTDIKSSFVLYGGSRHNNRDIPTDVNDIRLSPPQVIPKLDIQDTSKLPILKNHSTGKFDPGTKTKRDPFDPFAREIEVVGFSAMTNKIISTTIIMFIVIIMVSAYFVALPQLVG